MKEVEDEETPDAARRTVVFMKKGIGRIASDPARVYRAFRELAIGVDRMLTILLDTKGDTK
jgi:hypothetical protein